MLSNGSLSLKYTNAQLHPPCPPNLKNLTCGLIVAFENGPASAVGLDESHLKLRAEYPKLALLRLDASGERELGIIALAVGCPEIELDECGLEVDEGAGSVDLLEEERCNHRCCCLIEIVSEIVSSVALETGSGRAHRTVSSLSSPVLSLSFLPLPTNKCRSLVLQPSMFMN